MKMTSRQIFQGLFNLMLKQDMPVLSYGLVLTLQLKTIISVYTYIAVVTSPIYWGSLTR